MCCRGQGMEHTLPMFTVPRSAPCALGYLTLGAFSFGRCGQIYLVMRIQNMPAVM